MREPGNSKNGILEDAAAEAAGHRTEVVATAGELQVGDRLEVDAEAEFAVHGADGAVELEAPAVQVAVQAVLLPDGRAGGQVEARVVAEVPVVSQDRLAEIRRLT